LYIDIRHYDRPVIECPIGLCYNSFTAPGRRRKEYSAMTIKDQICEATDRLNDLRRAYYQQQATYEQVSGAAVALLTLRQQAEKAFYGKVKTKIDPRSIASLLRASA
jgi:hypothetical protein